jgi:hypothetical protein
MSLPEGVINGAFAETAVVSHFFFFSLSSTFPLHIVADILNG